MPTFEAFFPFFHGLLLGIIAMLIHEAGHMITARAIGIRVKGFGVRWNGIYTLRESGSPIQNFVISVAGPLTNLTLLAFWHLSPLFGMANLCFGICNLLPIRGSDGDRALDCLGQIQKPSPIAEKIQDRPAA